MTVLKAIEADAADERIQRLYGRITEKLGFEQVPVIFMYLANNSNLLNDMYMNLSKAWADSHTPQRTKALVAVGVSAALGSRYLLQLTGKLATTAGLGHRDISAAVGVATIMVSFNDYYKFRGLLPNGQEDFEHFKPGLHAQALVSSGLTTAEVESISIAVSVINDCKYCTTGHVSKANENDVTNDQVDEIVRLGAIIHALCQFAELAGLDNAEL